MNRKAMLAILATIILGGTYLLSNKIEVGSQATIPSWKWVDVVNDTQKLSAGDTCGVEFGGLITVTEVIDENLLVEYTAPKDHAGTSCSSGTQFIVKKFNFATMNARYAETLNSLLTEKRLVGRLLEQNYHGKPIDAGYGQWADVVNLIPVVQNFSNGHGHLSYGDTCAVKEGTVHARGESNGRVLYEYTAHGNPMGTQCPSGVLFFGE